MSCSSNLILARTHLQCVVPQQEMDRRIIRCHDLEKRSSCLLRIAALMAAFVPACLADWIGDAT
jgi:hypothetical protein